MTQSIVKTSVQSREKQASTHWNATMPAVKKSAHARDFEIDDRVQISLDALSPAERRVVEDVTRTKARFLAQASNPENVERLRPNDPFYSLKITPNLRLIYTQEGDRIVVLDLTNQGMLDWFASMRSGRAESAPKIKQRVRSKKTRQPS